MAISCSAHDGTTSLRGKRLADLGPAWVRCTLVLLLACAGWSADDADLQRLTRRVLGEAEALGLPSLDGTTLYEGFLTPAGQEHDDRLAARSFRHVHAKRLDGSWLIDLVVVTTADAIDPVEVAALKPFIPGSPEPAPPAGERYAAKPDILGQARRIAVGVPEASAHFPPENPWRLEFAYYPRQDRPSDPELALRLACRDYFLTHEAPAAALAIVPPAWQASVRRRGEHHVSPDPLPAGASGLVAGYHFPISGHEPGVDEPLLPEVDDGTLVGLADDRTTAVAGCTVGEVALFLLGERWGFDPALLAGRDPESPWDDAEHATVAHGLAAWWQRTAGMNLAQRWMTALAALPLEQAFTTIHQRERGMSKRRFTARDRLRNHTWEGSTAPAVPPDDAQDLLDDLTTLTLTRWEQRTAPPDDLTERGVLMFLAEVDGSRGFSSDTPAEVMAARLQRAQPLHARFLPLVASWPRQGAIAAPLTMWDDAQGHPDGLDALVRARLASPGLSTQDRRSTLQLWLRRCTAPRWLILQEILARPCSDVAWQALATLAADPFGQHVPYSGTDGENLIVWHLLQDHRLLPDELLQNFLPHAHNDTVAAALTMRLARYLSPYSYPRPSEADRKTVLAIRQPGATPAVIAAAIEALSRTYATRAADLCREMSIPLPAGLAPTPKETTSLVLPSGPPGLTTDEAAAITSALTQARSFGFPDLTRAQIIRGSLTGSDGQWNGVHIHLATGVWLANGTYALEHADPGATPEWILPADDDGPMRWARQLPPPDRARLVRVNLGRLADSDDDLVLPALAWWLSGDDHDGRGIIAAVMREAVRRHDIADTWSIIDGRGGEDRGVLAAVPSIPTGVRRSLARWFREQLVWAGDAASATHDVEAIMALLAPTDRLTWEPIITLLKSRLDLPESAPPGADLATRLQSWKDTMLDRQGRWHETQPVPATRADSAALVALLNDPRPTRRVAHHALPSPLGDVALDALCTLWRVDWRWLVVDDPTVAAILPPVDRVDDPVLRVDLGDDWLWGQTAWTPERRAIIMRALTRWWREHGATGESPIAGVFHTLPINHWAETLARQFAADVMDIRLGDALAARLRALPPPDPDGRMQQYAVQGILAAAIRFPTHAGLSAALAAWPAAPWLAAVAAIRSEFAGDTAAFDHWLTAGLAHSQPPLRQAYDDLEATPWGCIGLWAHHPTDARLASLRQRLAAGVDDVGMLWILRRVGSATWVATLDRSQEGHSAVHSQRAQAIPCALAMDGLKDIRPLSTKAREQLSLWSESESVDMHDLSSHVTDGARVCDWVAARLLSEDTVLSTNPRDENEALTYLTSPIAQRDAAIANLVQTVEQQALPNLRAAGIAAPTTPASPGTGASGF